MTHGSTQFLKDASHPSPRCKGTSCLLASYILDSFHYRSLEKFQVFWSSSSYQVTQYITEMITPKLGMSTERVPRKHPSLEAPPRAIMCLGRKNLGIGDLLILIPEFLLAVHSLDEGSNKESFFTHNMPLTFSPIYPIFNFNEYEWFR